MQDPEPDAAFLTTREVAQMLRVKERKVYDLAAAGEIPHARVTGKLLFPSAEIARWMAGGHGDAARPAILAGSHDPLLDWAVRYSECGLASLFDGSGAGLAAFRAGKAGLTGMHLPGRTDWNMDALDLDPPRQSVLIGWARRQQGLILRPGLGASVQSLADLATLRVVRRQEGAGARDLLDRLLAEAGLTDPTYLDQIARSEGDAALAVASGEADAGFGLQAMAGQYRLDFLPLVEEAFDLLIDRRVYFTAQVQALIRFAQGDDMAARAASLGGYDLAPLGRVRWLSP